MRNILITGASGFIGCNLLKRITYENNNGIHIFVRKTSNLWRLENYLEKFTIHYVDLSNYDDVYFSLKKIQPKEIYHLSSQGTSSFETKNNQEILKSNLIGTLNLLQCCKEFGCVEKFINVGSSSEYGRNNNPMKEDGEVNPEDVYSISKCSQTLLCNQFYEIYRLPIATFRIFSAYGPYESHNKLITKSIEKCLKNEDLILSSPNNVRDYVYVDDILDALLAELPPEAFGQIFNIGSGKQTSFSEVVNTIKKITNSNSNLLWNYYENKEQEITNWRSDNSKIKKYLKWDSKTPLIEGIEKTIKWYINEHR